MAKQTRETKPGPITETGVKKTLWIGREEAEALRLRAFQDRRSESSLVREALRRFLGLHG